MALHRSKTYWNAHQEPAIASSDFERTFDGIVEAHYSRLCTFALRILNAPDAAEDAVQDVLCKIWSHRIMEDLHDPVPYLYRAVRNQCLMILRHDRRWQTTDINTHDMPRDTSPDENELFDLQDAIASAIDALPPRTRLVFTMHRQQDLTYADIGRILGISIKTVETQMTRALKLLRRRLEPFFSVGAVAVLAAGQWSHLLF